MLNRVLRLFKLAPGDSNCGILVRQFGSSAVRQFVYVRSLTAYGACAALTRQIHRNTCTDS